MFPLLRAHLQKCVNRRLIISSRMSYNVNEETGFEISVGITAFVYPKNCGFNGILKQRFNDFVVREIDVNGTICKLNSTTVGEDNIALEDRFFKLANSGLEEVGNVLIRLEECDGLALASSTQDIRNFLEMCVNKDPNSAASILLGSSTDKQHRSLLHQIIKGSFAVSNDM